MSNLNSFCASCLIRETSKAVQNHQKDVDLEFFLGILRVDCIDWKLNCFDNEVWKYHAMCHYSLTCSLESWPTCKPQIGLFSNLLSLHCYRANFWKKNKVTSRFSIENVIPRQI